MFNDQPVTNKSNNSGFLKSIADFAGGLLPLAKQYYQIKENKKTQDFIRRQQIQRQQIQQRQIQQSQGQQQIQQTRQSFTMPSQIPWNLVAMGSGVLLITMLLLRRKRSKK